MSNSLNALNMDTPKDLERDASAFGGLFQQIMNEMKNSSPLWEDFTAKSTKLHACLKATMQAVSAFLDAFQKIADAATQTKGATKDIGTSLTRICMRHKALEAKLKTFTNSILDCLIIPLQDKLEEWKKCTAQLDKEHSKEYKKARAELKKRSIDTLRLQKKLRKGSSLNNGSLSNSFSGGTLPRSGGSGQFGTMSSSGGGDTFGLHGGSRDLSKILEGALRETTEKKQAFEDAEKHAIRTALIEERSRFCLFVSYLKPVVDEEVAMLSELTHVQEAMQQLEKHSVDPFALPPASEQVIQDLKGSCDSGTWSFQTPPSSPSSLGSRKSSMCSISSANSSSSGSTHSPTHNVHNRTILHQPMTTYSHIHHHHPPHPPGPLRYSSVSSGDSGFMSQDPIYPRTSTPYYDHLRKAGENQSEGSNTSSTASSNSSTPSSPYPPGSIPPTTTATWPNLQDSIQFERAACAIMNERPHTISSAYERGHQRPPLTVYTFQPPPSDGTSHPISPSTPVLTPIIEPQGQIQGLVYQSASEIYGILRGKNESKPPVPKRCSSLERPPPLNNSGSESSMLPPPPRNKTGKVSKEQRKDSTSSLKPIPTLPDFNQASADMIVPQPVYVNMHELNQMASAKLLRQQSNERAQMELPPPPPELMGHVSKVDGVESNLGVRGEGGSLASSGYGSQNQITMFGDEMNFNSGSSVYGYYGTSTSSGSGGSNSSTLTGMTSGTTSSGTTIGESGEVYGYLGRQGSRNSIGSQNQEKPLPPIRRNSSISVSSSPARNSSGPMSPLPMTSMYQQPPQQYIQNNSIYSNAPTQSSQTQEQKNNNGGIYYMTYGHTGMDSSGETTPHASMEQLPPPPSYLMGQIDPRQLSTPSFLDPDDPALKRMSVAETIKTLTEKNHQPVSPNMVRRSNSMKQPGEEKTPGSSNNNWNSKRNSSQPILQNNHNTNNSSGKDRGHLIQLLSEKLSVSQQQQQQQQQGYGTTHAQQQHQIPSNQTQQHIYGHLTYQQQNHPQTHHPQPQMSHQIVQLQNQNPASSQSANNSPRHPRRFSEELIKSTATFVQNRVLGNKTPPPVVTSKEIFVQTLNAKLSQMRVASPPTDRKGNTPTTTVTKTSFASKLVASVGSHGSSHHHHPKGNAVGDAAFRVRQWISSKTVQDPTLVRESLMDQIRRGTKLKQTRAMDDRSEPKVHH